MSTSSHPVLFLNFGNVDFVVVLLKFYGREMQFFASSQNSITKKSVFGRSEVFFLNV